MQGRPPLRVLLGVGLVAGSTLALQVLLTRLFSAELFYHFGFLAISLALLGTGAGALLIYLLPHRFAAGNIEARLATWSAIYAVLLFVVPALLVRIEFSFQNDLSFGFVVKLAATCGLSVLPFLAAGIVIALAIRHYVAAIGRVYAFDLAGAGLGALGIVPILWLVDAPTLIVALGAVAGAASLLFGYGEHRSRAVGAALAAIGSALALISGATDLYHLSPQTPTPGAEPIADRWTPLSRVVSYPPQTDDFAVVTYDRDAAPVPVWSRGDPHPGWRTLALGPQSIGHELIAGDDLLVIGGGGGRDIHNALSEGIERVDVIELNRKIRDAVDEDLGAVSGAPYSLPGVDTTIGDGRSALAGRSTLYDEIHIGFTNTLSAAAGTSFALAENNLYTVEAFEEYLDHLKPGGILSVSRLYKLAGPEALRATVLTLEALERDGVSDPARNVVVILGTGVGGDFGTILARVEPWSEAELGRIRRLADQRGLGLAYAPGGPYQREWAELAEAGDAERFCNDYPVDVCPPTDDRPFFLQVSRLGNLSDSGLAYLVSPNPFVVLLVVVAILVALSMLAFAVPLWVGGAAEDRPPVSALLYFAAIGLGFLALEIVLTQRFVLLLGFPTYSLSVVIFSLLVFTGVGALLSERLRDRRRGLIVALGGASALIAAAAFGMQPLIRELIDLSFAVRVIATIAMLAPIGLTLGMAMPVGLRRLAGLYPAAVPWAWGINGVTSVLGSALAIAVAIVAGFTVATLVALGCYLGALAHAVWGRWPATDSA